MCVCSIYLILYTYIIARQKCPFTFITNNTDGSYFHVAQNDGMAIGES